jgi:signal transduction histidine kinase
MSERLASLGQMASGIAHEINNPLAAIAGCAEGLLNRVEKDRYNPELFRNYLKIIEEEILRCKSITTSMLSFVRETTYEKKMVDIAEMLDKTLEIIGFQGRLKDVEVHNDYMAGLPLVHGSEGELRQVFLSVITNALDAMNDRGTLTIRTGTDGKAVFIKIGDSGPGIPPENINRIFDPFFTSKSAAGGTGLGLSIAGKIISNHKGKIDVVSRENEGAVFTITLPLPDEDKSGKTTS